ncbi:MAG: helix-turn-helix transcriptional regulator [Acidobacteriota bacterium]
MKGRGPGPKGIGNTMKEFGVRLRALREKRRISQQELADMVGIHLSQLGGLERGASFPTAETVIALARALHATTDALPRGDKSGLEETQIENIGLYERFRTFEHLKRDDQEALIRVIDAMIAKHKMEEALQSQ